jgi:hypothetical protein
VIALALAAAACSESAGDPPIPVQPDAGQVAVEIGVPGGDDGLAFEPLEQGGELRLQTFGQGGTHILLGIRCIGFGSRAFVTISIRNLTTGAVAITNPPARPQLLLCQDAGACDLVPLLATTSGVAELGAERDGLRVEVLASVRNEAGLEGEARTEAVLSTADL